MSEIKGMITALSLILLLALYVYATAPTATASKEEYVCPGDCAKPLLVCQRKCKGYLNTTVKYGNTTNVYSCECDNL